MSKIILASASPRRKDILNEMGLDFKIVPADIDESKIIEKEPYNLVMSLSKAKAGAIDHLDEEVVIAADTIVFVGKIYGKPYNRENAIKMIGELNGKWHTVYTGVTILSKDKETTFYEESKVKFKELTLEEIEKYVDTCKPFDKAGAYGIQDKQIVEKYEGSYTNIVGLPKEKLTVELKKLGVINGND